jgi:hypothetical protein
MTRCTSTSSTMDSTLMYNNNSHFWKPGQPPCLTLPIGPLHWITDCSTSGPSGLGTNLSTIRTYIQGHHNKSWPPRIPNPWNWTPHEGFDLRISLRKRNDEETMSVTIAERRGIMRHDVVPGSRTRIGDHIGPRRQHWKGNHRKKRREKWIPRSKS